MHVIRSVPWWTSTIAVIVTLRSSLSISLSRDVKACYQHLADIISMHQGKDHYILIVFVPCYRSYISLSLALLYGFLKVLLPLQHQHFTRFLLNLLSLWKEVVVVPTVKICLKDLMSGHHILSKQFGVFKNFSVAHVRYVRYALQNGCINIDAI